MAGMGTIGNVLSASVAGKMAYYSFAAGTTWDDKAAAAAIKADTGRDPISGDTVTISSSNLPSGVVFSETRVFDGAAWESVFSSPAAGTPLSNYPFPRSAATLSRKGYRSWSDFGALGAISEAGHAFVVDGDCVTLYDDSWTETRYYKDGKWIPEKEYFPGVLSPVSSQPGIGDVVKPDLMSKKLRSW